MKRVGRFLKALGEALDESGLRRGLRGFGPFVRDYLSFRRSGGDAPVRDLKPRLSDRTSTHELDKHYFYQGIWVARHVAQSRPKLHHDIGSQALFVGLLTSLTPVHFVDLRPLEVQIEDLIEERGTLLALPFGDHSVESISSLHVIEHVGLGRYGDALDPDGTRKAAAELSRVLAPGGRLYLSLPVGRRRTEFNAHRVHSVTDVAEMFGDLTLMEFSIVTDDGRWHRDVPLQGWDDQAYACGMFLFTRAPRSKPSPVGVQDLRATT